MKRWNQPIAYDMFESGIPTLSDPPRREEQSAAQAHRALTERLGLAEKQGSALERSDAFRTVKTLLKGRAAGKLRSLTLLCALGLSGSRDRASVIGAITEQMHLLGELVSSKPDWSMVDSITHADLEMWDSLTIAIGFDCGLLAQIEAFPYDEPAWSEIRATTDNLCVTLEERSGQAPTLELSTLSD